VEARAHEFNKFIAGHPASGFDQTAGVFTAKITQPICVMVTDLRQLRMEPVVGFAVKTLRLRSQYA
jgi:hypothetical protein